jgi:uncharacterized membrane protein
MSKNKKNFSKAEKRKIEKLKIRKRNLNMMIAAILFIIIIVAAVYVVSLGNTEDDESEFTPVANSNEISNTQIGIPLSSITSKAAFYTYESDGVDINYFAVRGNDDQIHVAIDACDVCYHAKEGYRHVDDVMECRNCGLTFPIEDIGEKNTGGGCWPSFLPIKIDDENIIIEKSDLISKRFMFE